MEYLLIGSYTNTESEKGIHLLEFDISQKSLSHKASFAAGNNPSYLAADNNKIYAVNETPDKAAITVISKQALQNKAAMETESICIHGKQPCHIVVENRFFSVSNYSSGDVVIGYFNNQGEVTDQHLVLFEEGGGPDPQRQKQPHLHATGVTPDGRFLITADLGSDRIAAYPIKNGKVKEKPVSVLQTPPGSGPRGFVFGKQKDIIYATAELSNEVFVIKFANEKFSLIEQHSLLPEDFVGNSYGGDIKFVALKNLLLVTNRGHDSIANFKVAEDGRLKQLEFSPCGGEFPRSIAISKCGEYLFCANQLSDKISAFEYENTTGLYQKKVGEVYLSKPTCIYLCE